MHHTLWMEVMNTRENLDKKKKNLERERESEEKSRQMKIYKLLIWQWVARSDVMKSESYPDHLREEVWRLRITCPTIA